MSTPPTGDTGDGSGDPDGNGLGDDVADELDLPFRPPLPPDDRVWRHPSEVARARAADGDRQGGTPQAGGRGATTTLPARAAALLLASGLIGATLAVAGVALLGGFDERVVEQRVAVPVTTGTRSATGTAAVAERTAPSVVALEIRHGQATTAGSAVVFRDDGHLLTSRLLVRDADEVVVVGHDGPLGAARIVGTDPATDVAVLHVDADGLEPAALAATDALGVGEETMAVGALADAGWSPSITTGLVSATNRRLEAADGADVHGLVVVEGPFVPDAVGGALVDEMGAVVGVTSAVPVLVDGGDDDFAAAIPIGLARHVAEELIDHGEVQHVWLGILGRDLSAADAAQRGLDGGAIVADVAEGGPAAGAGVLVGDMLVAVDDVDVVSMTQLVELLLRHVPGDEITMAIVRDGERITMRCVLAAKP